MSVNNKESHPAAHKVIRKFISNKLLYKITFTYVTFAAMWSGRSYVIAIDYDRYFICKHCHFDTSNRTYVPFECHKHVTKWTILGSLQIFEKWLLGWSWLSVRQHRTTRPPLDGFCKHLIFENFSKNCGENSCLAKLWQEWRLIYIQTNIYLYQYFAKLLEKIFSNNL